jgi:glycosyltransferase involved in cell wall biosynthesis
MGNLWHELNTAKSSVVARIRKLGGRFYLVCLPNLLFALDLLVFPILWAISWLRIGGKKLLGIKPSVVWGPTPIINIIESSSILQRLGYKSDTVVYATYYITQNFDVVLEKFLQNRLSGLCLPHLVFLWTLLKYDIYHFFYDFGFWAGMNIFPRAKWIELPLLRLAGKRVIVSAYGADVRCRSLDEMWPVNLCQECPEPGRHCICDCERAQVNAKYNCDWANVCLAMGDMHDYVFGSRVDFNYWPIDTRSVPYAGAGDHEGPLKIVHSPNHRHFKGTRYIQESVEQLKEKGYNLKLVLVERVSNAEARRMYAEADIVAAQCIAGWIGFTEIEAMAAGKPVMGYIRNMNRYLGHSPGCPIVNADRTELTARLEEVVANPALREELGRKGREYVEKEWSSEAMAPIYENLHADVWRNNHLLQTLSDRLRDFRYGEYGYRPGRETKSDLLGEWPVWRNGFLGIAKLSMACTASRHSPIREWC